MIKYIAIILVAIVAIAGVAIAYPYFTDGDGDGAPDSTADEAGEPKTYEEYKEDDSGTREEYLQKYQDNLYLTGYMEFDDDLVKKIGITQNKFITPSGGYPLNIFRFFSKEDFLIKVRMYDEEENPIFGETTLGEGSFGANPLFGTVQIPFNIEMEGANPCDFRGGGIYSLYIDFYYKGVHTSSGTGSLRMNYEACYPCLGGT